MRYIWVMRNRVSNKLKYFRYKQTAIDYVENLMPQGMWVDDTYWKTENGRQAGRQPVYTLMKAELL